MARKLCIFNYKEGNPPLSSTSFFHSLLASPHFHYFNSHHHHHISIVFPSPPPTHYGTYIDLTSPLIDPKSTLHRPYIDSTLNLQPHSFQQSLFVMISIVNSEAKYHHHHHYTSIVFHPPLQPPSSYNVSLHYHLHRHHHQHHHHHISTV